MSTTPPPPAAINRSRQGRGYRWTPFRAEARPSQKQEPRDNLLRTLDTLVECGVKAWWFAVSSAGSYPLFPSKHLPCRPDADAELYPWLVAEAHARDISLMSWEYLNRAPILAAQHPDWRYRWFPRHGEEHDQDQGFVCYNSPYGQKLMDFTVEVVGDLGFDGVWFDGCFLEAHNGRDVGCCCSFCQAKYERETGNTFPQHLDGPAADHADFIAWRYQDFVGYWRRLSQYVEGRCPEALVVFNHFNRMGINWENGAPLLTTPMPGMIASETNGRRSHLMLHHKILQAINHDGQPTEIWDAGLDGARGTYPHRPNPEPASLIFHCQASATVGGFGSFGVGAVAEMGETLSAMTRAIEPIAPYIGGEPVAPIGLVVSGTTKDFAHDPDSYPYWKLVHGMHNLLNALHLPSSVVLDDVLEDAEQLSRWPVLVLADTVCISDAAAAAIDTYLQGGGKVLALGEIGLRDERGTVRDTGVLDGLLGIAGRHDEFIHPVLQIAADDLKGHGLGDAYLISGPARLFEAADGVEVLATATYRENAEQAKRTRRFTPEGMMQDIGASRTGVAAVRGQRGKGTFVYVAGSLGNGYSDNPNRRTREFVRRLLAPWIDPPFTTDAPANVVVTAWRQDNQLRVHLLNVPHDLLRFTGRTLDDADRCWPEDFTPTAPITVTVPGSWAKAWSPTNATQLKTRLGADRATLTLGSLDQHAVVVLEQSADA